MKHHVVAHEHHPEMNNKLANIFPPMHACMIPTYHGAIMIYEEIDSPQCIVGDPTNLYHVRSITRVMMQSMGETISCKWSCLVDMIINCGCIHTRY